MPRPVTSCTIAVSDGLVARTDTAAVRRLQRSALRLLLSVHEVDCKNCPANKHCELQRLARFLKVGLKPKDLPAHRKTPILDDAHPCFSYYPNRCVLCGKCVEVCRRAAGQTVMAFSRRGFDTILHVDPGAADPGRCENCRSCVEICPVGALVMKGG
jgi:bidirectional [NiFe] hydrogenase diaphorase subunit